MGFLTFGEMKEEISQTLGDKVGASDERLGRWINMAYLEVARKRCFHDLEQIDATIMTVDGTRNYALEADLFAIISVADLTNKHRLVWAAPKQYQKFDRTQEGQPFYFTRIANSIYLWPTPDEDDYEIEVIYTEEPEILSSDGDLSVLPGAFDRAILFYAERNGFLTLGLEEKATLRYQSGENYMAVMEKEMTREGGIPAVGVRPICDFEDLSDMETAAP